MAICMACKEVIFHPLCAGCLSKEFEVWLEEKGYEKIKEDYLKVKPHILSLCKGEGPLCIKCGQKTYSVCMYCFSEILYRWLEKHHPYVIPEFLKIFNFDYNQTGYTVGTFYSQELIPDDIL